MVAATMMVAVTPKQARDLTRTDTSRSDRSGRIRWMMKKRRKVPMRMSSPQRLKKRRFSFAHSFSSFLISSGVRFFRGPKVYSRVTLMPVMMDMVARSPSVICRRRETSRS